MMEAIRLIEQSANAAEYAAKLDKILKDMRKIEKENVRKITKAAEEMRKNIHDHLRGMAKPAGGRLTPDQVEAMRVYAAEQIGNFRKEATQILEGTVSKMRDAGLAQGEAFLDAVEMTAAGIPGVSAEQVLAANRYTADLITGLTAETHKKVNMALSQALLGELTPYGAMRSVDVALGVGREHGISYQAERIVRTEGTRFNSLTQQHNLNALKDRLPKEEQKLLKKRWMAFIDDRTRPSHIAAHDQVVGINKPFIVGGIELRFPGDPLGSPAETINCRCRSVIEEEAIDEILIQRGVELKPAKGRPRNK